MKVPSRMLGLIALLGATLGCQGQRAPEAGIPGPSPSPFPYVAPESVGLSSARLGALVDTMEQWVDRGDVVGAELLLIKDRKIVLHEAVGWKDRERRIPYERNTIARIRSMTKPFVGTSIQMLVEEGKLRLSDRVSQYLPSWDNERSRDITIRQLLYHRGGFTQPGYPAPVASYGSLMESVDAVGQAGPEHPPGSRYEYSDAGSGTLAAVVQTVSAMPAERFIETRMLEPLRMDDSFTMLMLDDPHRPRISSTYRRSESNAPFEKYWENTEPQVMRFFRGSGGIYSTPVDYAKFLALWMDYGRTDSLRLLERETVIAALQSMPTGGPSEYAMQWQIFGPPADTADGLPVFGHGGSDGTFAYADPGRDLMFLYFTQSRGGATRRRLMDLALAAMGQE